MQGIAVLLGLVAAACLYLAAPNQVLISPARRPLSPRALCLLALVLTVASAWTMSVPEGWAVAIAATLITLTCCLSLWPFIGTWASHRRGVRDISDTSEDGTAQGSAS
ncbi:hypothetical protein [Cupriavidus plantarum]|uniref:hypothetical protein n=1 Tax=Cupriavidus plantarum TaxID=942865 RepID=UPI000E2285EB|nr:hypothetical protein [Cupriavidus plantarum]REF02171.1 hypothetical protein C7418_0965 [Cupriavidus plantarum]